MGHAYLEVWQEAGSDAGRENFPLLHDRVALGRSVTNDITFRADDTVSRLHAVLERFPSGWAIRGMDSTNGTFVNGKRLVGDRVLRDFDEIGIGRNRLVFHASGSDDTRTTRRRADLPRLTPTERKVLIALCRPMLEPRTFNRPLDAKELAEIFVVSEAAIRQHLGNLCEKFGIRGSDSIGRAELANQAVDQGVVTLSDLREESRPPSTEDGPTRAG